MAFSHTLFAHKKIIILVFVLPLVIVLGHTYYVYRTFMSIPRYDDATNYLIQHRNVFIALYTIKPYTEKISAFFAGPAPKKTRVEKLADWVEARIMYAIINNEKVKSVKDLPWLERSALRALDGSSYINSLYQNGLYYMTKTQPTPKGYGGQAQPVPTK